MTDTPKILRDMTDAEIGALVRKFSEGQTIQSRYPQISNKWHITARPDWDRAAAYRIAPPKFLPLEAGKVYRTADGVDRTCIAVRGNTAWLIHTEESAAYVWGAETGENRVHGNVTGLSDNQDEKDDYISPSWRTGE